MLSFLDQDSTKLSFFTNTRYHGIEQAPLQHSANTESIFYSCAALLAVIHQPMRKSYLRSEVNVNLNPLVGIVASLW